MFLGQYEHTIDEKGRITIPSEYRDVLGDLVYLTRGFDGNLVAFPSELFNMLSTRIETINFLDMNSRILRRLIFSNAKGLKFDNAGRILIPAFLRNAANLNDIAIIAGNSEYFEIWSPENWQSQELTYSDIQANEKRFSALDLSTLP